MDNAIPFEIWAAEFKAKVIALGLPLPEEELIDLAHMEGLSVDEAVAEVKAGS